MANKKTKNLYAIAAIAVAIFIVSAAYHYQNAPPPGTKATTSAQIIIIYKNGATEVFPKPISAATLTDNTGKAISTITAKIYVTPTLSLPMMAGDTLRLFAKTGTIADIASLSALTNNIVGGYINQLNAYGDITPGSPNLVAVRTYTETDLNSILSPGSSGVSVVLSTPGATIKLQQVGYSLKSFDTPAGNLATITLSRSAAEIFITNVLMSSTFDSVPSTTPSAGIYGDVNNDGVVNSTDSIYLANYVMHVPGYTSPNLDLADIDGSAAVNLNDAAIIAQYASGERNISLVFRTGQPRPTKGDANGDGHIDQLDSAYINTLIGNGDIYNATVIARADMNCNGKLDTGDMTIIQRIDAGMSYTKCWP